MNKKYFFSHRVTAMLLTLALCLGMIPTASAAQQNSYPIEVQLWCGKDYYFNLWSHQYVYKYKSPEIGRQLYLEYAAGEVKTEWEFQKRLQELEVTDNG